MPSTSCGSTCLSVDGGIRSQCPEHAYRAILQSMLNAQQASVLCAVLTVPSVPRQRMFGHCWRCRDSMVAQCAMHSVRCPNATRACAQCALHTAPCNISCPCMINKDVVHAAVAALLRSFSFSCSDPHRSLAPGIGLTSTHAWRNASIS